jgi:hypothetical protein
MSVAITQSLRAPLQVFPNAMFDHGTLHALRATVNGVKHPAGITFTEHGDLNQHGRTTSANHCKR